MPLGQAIKRAREAHGITREQLDATLARLTPKELTVLEATARGLLAARSIDEN